MESKSNKPTRGRPQNEAEPADHVLFYRVTASRKGAYVKASRDAGQKLTEWTFNHLDKAAGYEAEG